IRYHEDCIESKLQHPRMQAILSPFVAPFKDTHYFWSFYEILRRMMATSIVILIQMSDEENSTDLLYASAFALLGITVHCYARPYISVTANHLQLLVLVAQSVTITGYISEKHLLDESSMVVGITLLCTHVMLGIAIAFFIVRGFRMHSFFTMVRLK
ncbi:hypothetical protein CYMTET_28437, partial [Cymbomonas tetramitiformis]